MVQLEEVTVKVPLTIANMCVRQPRGAVSSTRGLEARVGKPLSVSFEKWEEWKSCQGRREANIIPLFKNEEKVHSGNQM